MTSMTDEELITQLREAKITQDLRYTLEDAAAARIEELVKERDREHTAAENFAIKLDEFSAYINRLKADNEALIAERDDAEWVEVLRRTYQRAKEAEAKLAECLEQNALLEERLSKAVEAIQKMTEHEHCPYDVWKTGTDVVAELEKDT